MMILVGNCDMEILFLEEKGYAFLLEQYSFVDSHPCYHFSFITKPPYSQ
jgi:hypothetical protein